ncbi:protein-tyrosine-phosphatase MKP1 [Humulus lupulus]|uniref:protein-tyrosine-phosphatase MKP1 n=1 Tax=Humulus lupulus TaxID=3486 RepID=UPI002B408EA4|nr:protein-tyrosine-phosphatase MKP1 [Humulus lupulus]
MVGKDDASGASWGPSQPPSGSRKMFWRSASWSASRSSLHNPENEEKDVADPSNGSIGNGHGQNRRFPAPLTPRSQQNCKARSCLPPLQPLSIARRSLDEWPKASSDDIGEWPQPPTPSGRGGGERLKLDLSSIQRNQPDKNGGLVRRDKIAFFDKECSKVAEHIYLGGDAVARDREILKQNGITHVLNCVGFVCPEYFKADFMYRTLWLQDSPSEDITSILYDVFDYFEDVREQRGRVFVHCCQGVSRSTSLVIAYLMWREGQSFDDAFQYVKAARGIADPNMGFACQLLQCQKRVHAFPLSPSSLLRMYRLAPHSPYDPLHLVPKMLNDPSPAALDSRGAFIIHVPSAIYVWIGKSCETIMERDARGAVCQIVRYERVQGPITVLKEGEEPLYFWDAFSNLLPLMDKSANVNVVGKSAIRIVPGDRKVESYNVDFEIFQKAIMGGFVPPFASSENEHETHLPARESSWSLLRRKFASGNMKDFVSAPRIPLSRVYSDSMMLVHSSKISASPSSVSSSSSSSSSSSPSPPYLSPDSISSEPSTSFKYFPESSLDSPSAASGVPSSLSNFSNLSLLSTKASSQSTSRSPEIAGSNLTSQSNSSPFKKSSPSLAERRGSMSKSLKLPDLSEKMRATPTFSILPDDQDGAVNVSHGSCFLAINVRNASETRDGVENGERASPEHCDIYPSRETGFDPSQTKDDFVKHCGEPRREGSDFSAQNGIEESGGSTRYDVSHALICRWPSLEKMTTFGVNDLDSRATFAVLSPNTGLGKNEERILYVWVGRSADRGKCQLKLDSGKGSDGLEELDWNQVGSDMLIQMGLPKGLKIKIVKEDEEPTEFLAMLNLL